MVDTWAIGAAIAVVIGILLIWKFVKFAFKIALVVGIAVLLFLGAQQLGWIGG